MAFYRIPKSPDLSKYQVDVSPGKRQAFYGLPRHVAFCQSCVISNQRPSAAVEYEHTRDSKKSTINFQADGRCDACHVAEKKNHEIDWVAREKQLIELCDRHRRNDGHYDCIVPGSGGKDSFYQSHILKHKYGMHPLTMTWAPHIYTDWGWRNFQKWIHAGFDNYLVTPNGRVHRLLTRLAVENLYHPFQPFIIGQKSIAMKLSTQMDIPLIFYGDHGADYGQPIQEASEEQMAWDYFTSADESKIFLGGSSVADLKNEFDLQENEIAAYMPANPEKLRNTGTMVHYLGYYLRWHPQSCYYYAVEHGGFEASPERTVGSYSKYSSIDDKVDDLHYYTTFIKFGIGRATYDASQEVRSGDIDRDEGVALVRRYDGEFPERFIKEIFEYLSIPEKHYPVASKRFEQPIMDRSYFEALTDQFRSPHLWQYHNGAWSLRRAVWHENQ